MGASSGRGSAPQKSTAMMGDQFGYRPDRAGGGNQPMMTTVPPVVGGGQWGMPPGQIPARGGGGNQTMGGGITLGNGTTMQDNFNPGIGGDGSYGQIPQMLQSLMGGGVSGRMGRPAGDVGDGWMQRRPMENQWGVDTKTPVTTMGRRVGRRR